MSKKSEEFRYEAVDREGEGTLFVVYRARDKTLSKPVALKVLRQKFSRDPLFAENLKKAARATVDLPHPNIAQVYSTGEEDGFLFVATEYVKGERLDVKLRRESPLPRKEALALLTQICEAVAYAHQNGIVHSDLRPRNIFVGNDGKIKVTDFGIGNAFTASKVSLADTVPDASRYTAPEIAQGAPPSSYSDLYALGVVAYHMFTATVPFDGKSAQTILEQQILKNPPPPSNFNPSISPEVEEVILKLLQKAPHDRYSSAAELLKHLRQIEAGSQPGQVVTDWGNATLQRPRSISAREKIAQPSSLSEGNRSSLSSSIWSMATILASILLILGAYFLWIATNPKEVTVPDVSGRPTAEAEGILESVGLHFTEARQEYDTRIPEGCVITTIPTPGRRVKENRTISAIVSRGQELVSAPDLRDVPVDKAKQMIRSAGLELGKVQEVYNPVIPRGLVVSQMPPATERIGKDTRIWLQVSRGPEPSTPEPEPSSTESPSERTFNVVVDVPQGPARQEVKIVVRDAQGTRTDYEEMHTPGDKVERDIAVAGKGLIRVYLAGTLVEEKEF